jgi:KUP system potassium uptake protein
VHQRLIVVHVDVQMIPRIPRSDRATVRCLDHGIWIADMHYGFMEHPNLPRALGRCDFGGVPLDPEDTTYFLSKETIIPKPGPILRTLGCALFAFMHRNAADASVFYRVTPDRTVELRSRMPL